MEKLLIDNVSKVVTNQTILSSVSLEIENGLFGLLGPNGAGKTTLMKVLATILRPNSGSISYGGLQWREHPERVRQELGYLPQNFGCYRNITGYECLDYIGTLKGIHNKKTRHLNIQMILECVNLTSEANKKIGHYSGGMKRRLGIAQALLGDPSIIIVDEPTAGLDPEERIRFRNILRDVSSQRVVIISTHIVEDIEATCSAVAVLNKGIAKSFHTLDELAQVAVDNVWKWKVKNVDIAKLQDKYKVIKYTTHKDYVELRVLSKEKPSIDAITTKPTLEEGYLTWIQN